MTTTLITGTSTGIGFAAAVQMARAGHDVIATMRNPGRAPRLAELAERDALPITVLSLDVDSDASVDQAFGEAVALKGPIDVLVNNAGVGQAFSVEDASLDEFRQTMETNFFGALRCMKQVIPAMRERGSGCIINVTSISGRIASTPQAAYSASKFALEAATEVLAQEMHPLDVRVALVEPGVIATPIFNKLHDLLETPYAGERRISALFAASLSVGQVPPELVGDKILEIAEDPAPMLRHPVGPDAEPFIAWRDAMSDEEWVALNGLVDDEEWAARIEADFGLNVRPFLGTTPAGIVRE